MNPAPPVIKTCCMRLFLLLTTEEMLCAPFSTVGRLQTQREKKSCLDEQENCNAAPVPSLGCSKPRRSGGAKERFMSKIRVAIIGVGNCASSLVQGVQFYRTAEPDAFVPGLMHVDLGGYRPRDIEFTAAFDVSAHKVGLDLGEAIYAEPNNTIRFADVPKLGVTVSRGMTHDGLGSYLKDVVPKSTASTDDIVGILKSTKTDVVVSYLPVGSEMATKWYVEQVLEAGCAFVNCIPVFIASEPYWQRRFAKRGLPIIGDDIKSQVGATITHRILTNLFR